jgi:Fur family transcriptional regulator, zinc uptake regulator
MAHDTHTHAHPHPPAAATRTDQVLAEAEVRMMAAGERFTAPRKRVLKLLLEAQRPLKAYDLIAGMARADTPANPPTVYRALQFLTRTGLVHRIESDASYVVCSHGHAEGGHVALMLVCDGCGAVRESHLDRVEAQARDAAAAAGFALERLVVEARGRCAACQAGGRPEGLA